MQKHIFPIFSLCPLFACYKIVTKSLYNRIWVYVTHAPTISNNVHKSQLAPLPTAILQNHLLLIMKDKKWGNESSCGNYSKVLNSQATQQVIGLELKCNKATKFISWKCQELQKKKTGWGISLKEINIIFSIQMWSSVNNLANNCFSYKGTFL